MAVNSLLPQFDGIPGWLSGFSKRYDSCWDIIWCKIIDYPWHQRRVRNDAPAAMVPPRRNSDRQDKRVLRDEEIGLFRW